MTYYTGLDVSLRSENTECPGTLAGRKAAGVEPARECLTPPTGFEARSFCPAAKGSVVLRGNWTLVQYRHPH
ncbi:hypothetical protein P3T16_001626 [Paraburkholderia sp. GAS42]